MDSLTTAGRSALMARVKARGNRSTEMRVAAALRALRIRGWRRHSKLLPGKPDFAFMRQHVAVFIDGCFWHGCPVCGRIPKSNAAFWRKKIAGNKARDTTVNRELRRRGYKVIRIWEHEVPGTRWVRKLRDELARPGNRLASKRRAT